MYFSVNSVLHCGDEFDPTSISLLRMTGVQVVEYKRKINNILNFGIFASSDVDFKYNFVFG